MTVTPIRHYPQPRTEGLELTEVVVGDLSAAELRAALNAGLPNVVCPDNLAINEINQERLDHEAANPQTRNTYGRE